MKVFPVQHSRQLCRSHCKGIPLISTLWCRKAVSSWGRTGRQDTVEMKASANEHFPQAANTINPGEINAFQANWQERKRKRKKPSWVLWFYSFPATDRRQGGKGCYCPCLMMASLLCSRQNQRGHWYRWRLAGDSSKGQLKDLIHYFQEMTVIMSTRLASKAEVLCTCGTLARSVIYSSVQGAPACNTLTTVIPCSARENRTEVSVSAGFSVSWVTG